MPRRLAFIGLGIMGQPIAGHLLAAGHSLVVHSRTKSRAEPLIASGATWADSPADAARHAEVIFICVPDTPDVDKVVTGDDGILIASSGGSTIVDHSTISPAATRAIAAKAADREIHFIDAPVSGGDIGAKSASLSIMCGGDAGAFADVLPLLQCLGKTITHCGDVGAGQLTKLVNQILVLGTLMAVSEAVSFATKNGLDLDTTFRAVGAGAARSWQLEQLGPKMARGDFAPGFLVDLAQKDLRLVLDAAKAANVTLPTIHQVHELYKTVQSMGYGRDGTQAIYRAVERLRPQ